MPIYEYECGSCGHRLEAIQKMSELALKDCPSCGKSALRKLISAAGFQLKGSGWYVTDFKGGGKKEKPRSSESTPPESSPPKKKASGGCGSGGCGCAH